MKKEGILTIVFTLLLTLSLGSYVYLKSSAPIKGQDGSNSYTIEKTEVPADEQRSDMFLPDVALIKKAYEVTKRVLSVTQ